MPSWGIHLEIANLLIKRISNIDKNLFIFGNILPDINNGYVIKEISHNIKHKITHYEENKEFKNYKIFFDKYQDKFDDSIVLGYFCHLLTDFYFNDLTYSKKGMHDDSGKLIGINLNSGENWLCAQEEARQIKTNDFKIFSNYIYENIKLEKLKYDKEILESSKIIDEINIVEEDVLKTIEYLNSHIEGKRKILEQSGCKCYKIFREDELKKHVDLCVDYIIGFLESKN